MLGGGYQRRFGRVARQCANGDDDKIAFCPQNGWTEFHHGRLRCAFGHHRRPAAEELGDILVDHTRSGEALTQVIKHGLRLRSFSFPHQN
jgi:hypothetical protein